MSEILFQTPEGRSVPAVTADEMRRIDRIAVDELGLTILQMMENAGRNLAANSRLLLRDGRVIILAGAGGNGGGGLACARHLTNRDVPITVILDRDPAAFEGATATQYSILKAMGVPMTTAHDRIASADLIVDALIGYGLEDAPRGRAGDLVEEVSATNTPVLSLDIPSGYDATTGETPGTAIHPDRTLTLALPKTGLQNIPGELYVADIGIPVVPFRRLGLSYTNPFTDEYWFRLIPHPD